MSSERSPFATARKWVGLDGTQPQRRAAWNIVDQGISSLTNVVIALLVARNVSAAEFGLFAAVAAIYALGVGLVRATQVQPMLIQFAAHRSEDQLRETGRSAASFCVLSGALMSAVLVAIALAVRGDLRVLLLVLAVALPLLLLQDMLRGLFVLAGTPRSAAFNDALWGLGTFTYAGAAVVFDWRVSATSALVIWVGLGMVAALAGVVQAGLGGPGCLNGARARSWYFETRHLWPGLLAEFTVAVGLGYAVLALTAWAEGADAVAALRGVQLLVFGPWSVLAVALSSHLLPELVRQGGSANHDVRVRVRRFALLISGVTAGLGLVVAVLPNSIGYRLVGETWDGVKRLVIPWAVLQLALGVQFAVTLALRAGGHVTHSGVVSGICATAVFGAAMVGALSGDVRRMLWAMAITQVAVSIVLILNGRGMPGGRAVLLSRAHVRDLVRPRIPAGTIWLDAPRRPMHPANLRFLVNLVFVGSCFPFFRLLPIGQSEAQPWVGIVAGFAILSYGVTRRATRAFVPLGACVTVGSALALILRWWTGRGVVDIATSAAIALSPIFAAAFLAGRIKLISLRVVDAVIVAWVGLGVIQQVAPVLLRATGLERALAVVIPRFTANSLGASGRGVTMFSPEPAYGATTLMLLAVLVADQVVRRQRVGHRAAWALSGIVVGFILNRSGTMVVNLAMFGGTIATVIVVRAFRTRTRSGVLVFTGALLVGLGLFMAPADSPRPVRLAQGLLKGVTEGPGAIVSPDTETRLAHVRVGYANTMVNSGLGGGAGSVVDLTIAGIERLPNAADIVVTTATKPFAYAPFVGTEYGVIGLGLVMWAWLTLAGPVIRTRRLPPSVWGTLGVASLGLFALSPVSIPAYWVMLVIASTSATDHARRQAGDPGRHEAGQELHLHQQVAGAGAAS